MLTLEDLPSEILNIVFSYISGTDIAKNCSLVCQRWRDIINCMTFWKLKCKVTKKCIPGITPWRRDRNHDDADGDVDDDYYYYYKRLYFFNPYNRNLLKNTYAIYGCSRWRIKEDGGNGFNIEDPPLDVRPLSDFVPKYEVADVGDVKVWVTSYYWCVKSQEVDLNAEGVDLWVMDTIRPNIQVSEWYSARRDSGCAYELTVRLLDNMGRQKDSHVFLRQFVQGEGGDWNKECHTFKDYPPGVRYVDFRHGGKDMEFRHGHYGVKLALPSVRLIFQ